MATLTKSPEGGALIEIPMKRPRFLVPPFSWIFPYSDARRVKLDPLGTAILDLCNGKVTVEQIIETFAAANRLTFREAQVPVMHFLRLLSQRGVLAMAVGERKPEE